MSNVHSLLDGFILSNTRIESFQVDMSDIAKAECLGGGGTNARRQLSHLQGSHDAREGHKGKGVVGQRQHMDIGLLYHENI